MKMFQMTLACAMCAGAAHAGMSVSTYDDLAEGFQGESAYYNGVTYHSVNNVAGVYPDGATFEPGGGVEGLGSSVIVENAGFLYNDYPDWGSASNALTFGSTFMPGSNLSLGAISTVTMDLDSVADYASFDMAYYENGPWGGIVFHFDAYLGSDLVTSDEFTIADLNGPDGRDNLTFGTMTVQGAQFDSLHLYATLGSDYTAPRILMDNLTINSVPAPASLGLLLGAGGLVSRRRR